MFYGKMFHESHEIFVCMYSDWIRIHNSGKEKPKTLLFISGCKLAANAPQVTGIKPHDG